ncbi:MAG: hypothetical protein EOP04_24285 [Proteobacteria bacterium]|nr:MAG: hypothetical protein EOP04_24285 [Pseudomonadota bacterium]
MSRISLALLASVYLMSCKEDDKDTVFSGSAKLAATSVSAPASVPTLTAVDAKLELASFIPSPRISASLTKLLQSDDDGAVDDADNDEGDGSSDAPVPTEEEDAVSSCLQVQVEGVKLKAYGDTVSFDATLDAAACIASSFKEANATEVKIEKAIISTYLEASCEGKDFSALNGKTLKEAATALEGECEGKITNFESSLSSSKGTITLAGQTIKFDIETTTANSKSDGTACVATIANGVRTENGCVSVEKTVDAIDPTNNSFRKTTSNNLTWNEANPGDYYDSGSFSVVVNNWSGTITYSGATTPPTFSITNGTTTETGTLIY